MDPEEEIKRTLYQLEVGRQQMEQLAKQAQLLEAAVGELNSTVEALNGLKGEKTGAEVLVAVGAGSYVRASVKDTDNVLVSIGAEMSVEKRIPEAVEMLAIRRKQLTESHASVQKTLGELASKLNELNNQAERMMGQSQ